MAHKIPKVSIVIPVYKVEKYVGECIQSVINQTLKDIEIIIINDGSPDNSGSICGEYAAKDPRIIYAAQVNQGVSAARNKGLSLARGEYIYFLDSDDTLSSDYIETAFQKANHTADLVIISGKPLRYMHALGTLNMFIRKKFLDKHPLLKFPKGIQPCEDAILAHEILALTDNILSCIHPGYFYRQHKEQNHQNIDVNPEKIIQQIPVWLRVLDEFYDFYDLRAQKALYLALFVRFEIFKHATYLPLKEEQRQQLHKIIRDYYQRAVKPYLTPQEEKTLGLQFRIYVAFPRVSYFTWIYRFIKIKRLIVKPFHQKETL